MARTFAYLRVSTSGQTMENQLREIEAAGFAVDKRRVVSDISPGVRAAARPHEADGQAGAG